MATLIASNYTSTSSSTYGFMALTLPKGTIKNSKTYTLWCRYKWDKNGTASTYPLAMFLYRNTWTNTINFTNTPSDYTTLYKTWTSPSDAESYEWYIKCYANGKHNDGVADGAILSMDWYELWEGDATEFSLTDAIARSNNTSATSFQEIINACVNPGYFSSVEPITSLRAWKGYHFETGYNIAVSLSSTSVAASGGTITVTYTITDKNTNAGISGVTPTVTSTLGTVSNITATNSSGVGTAKVTVASLGTTLKTDTTSGTVTVTKSGSGSKTFSQATNKITSITSITPSAGSITAPSTYTAAKNTKTVTTNTNSSCSAVVKFESGSSATTAYASTAYGTWSWQYSWSSNQSYATLTSAHALNMNVTMTSRGTTIGNSRSATITRTCAWTYTVAAGNSSTGSALTKSGSKGCTATVTQAGNYVTGIAAAKGTYAMTYAAIPAGGGTVTPTGSGSPTTTYIFSSGDESPTTPASTYGSRSTSSTYSWAGASGTFSSLNTSTGAVTAVSRGSNTGAALSGPTVTRTVTVTWTPTSSYNSAGTKTSKYTITMTPTQAKNELSTYGAITVNLSYPTVSGWRNGSTSTPTLSYTQAATYTSGYPTTITPSGTVSFTHNSSNSNNPFSLNSTTGAVTWSSDNTSGAVRSRKVDVTVTANGKTGTATAEVKQNCYSFNASVSSSVGQNYVSLGGSATLTASVDNTTYTPTYTWSVIASSANYSPSNYGYGSGNVFYFNNPSSNDTGSVTVRCVVTAGGYTETVDTIVYLRYVDYS